MLQNADFIQSLTKDFLTCEISATASSVIAPEGLFRSLESIPKVRNYDLFELENNTFLSLVCKNENVSATMQSQPCLETPEGDSKVNNFAEKVIANSSVKT